eukprot:3940789-Rhodomonas_salina.1
MPAIVRPVPATVAGVHAVVPRVVIGLGRGTSRPVHVKRRYWPPTPRVLLGAAIRRVARRLRLGIARFRHLPGQFQVPGSGATTPF